MDAGVDPVIYQETNLFKPENEKEDLNKIYKISDLDKNDRLLLYYYYTTEQYRNKIE